MAVIIKEIVVKATIELADDKKRDRVNDTENAALSNRISLIMDELAKKTRDKNER